MSEHTFFLKRHIAGGDGENERMLWKEGSVGGERGSCEVTVINRAFNRTAAAALLLQHAFMYTYVFITHTHTEEKESNALLALSALHKAMRENCRDRFAVLTLFYFSPVPLQSSSGLIKKRCRIRMRTVIITSECSKEQNTTGAC